MAKSTKAKNNPPQEAASIKRLYRHEHDKIFGGVCGGIASYFNIDPVVVRVVWALATLISMGFGIIAYIIAWIIIPARSGKAV